MTTARGVTRSVLALATLAAACDGSLPAPCEGGGCGTQVSTRHTFQYGFNGRKVDMLFVLDDTAAIAPHREAIASGLAAIAPSLTGAPRPISLHVGFVRAGGCDTSTRVAACGIRRPEQFARSEWCNTMTNVPGTFAEALTCLGDLGSEDCGPAQPLSAALQALASPRPGWEDFLRTDAYLMIVVVSAADDASGQPGQLTAVLDLAERAKQLKPDPSQVLVSIIGPGDCAPGDVPGPRLTDFVNQFGANGLYVGLCSGQFGVAIQRIGEFTNERLLPPCASHLRDVDLETPGLQPNCTITRTSSFPVGSIITQALPSCDLGPAPCWRLGPPGSCNRDAAGQIIDIEFEPEWCSEAVTSFTIECLTCADANDPACATSR